MDRRDCSTVIAEMLTKIPKENEDLIKALNWNMEDASFKAPEETLQWERTMHTLGKYIPLPETEWHFEVISVFTKKSIEELKIDFDQS